MAFFLTKHPRSFEQYFSNYTNVEPSGYEPFDTPLTPRILIYLHSSSSFG